jgi:DNA-binding NtrC family response regulator
VATTRARANGTTASAWNGSADAEAAGAPVEESWNAEFLGFERQRLLDALAEAQNNKSEAARLLGMPRSTLCSKLEKHGLIDNKGARAKGQSG